jgi:hypothetical protein
MKKLFERKKEIIIMADKKVTKREMFEGLKAILTENFEAAEVAEYVEFLDKEVGAIDARSEKEKARRAEKKAEGDALGDAVKVAIEGAEEPITAEGIVDKVIEEFPEATVAKVRYRASKLVKDEVVTKTELKVDGRKVVAYSI